MTPIETTKSVFAAFGAGDIDAIVALLDPDIEIEFYGPSIIPYAGHYRGKAEARRFFETVLSSVDIHQFDPLDFFGEGDKVTVTGHLRLTARSTGGEIESDFAHVITVRGEKWLRFRDFMDTSVAVAAFSA